RARTAGGDRVPVARAAGSRRQGGRSTLTAVEHVALNGRTVAGFGLGTPLPEWVAMRNKLQDMDRLIASGRGDTLVAGGGCTEPGGGIVPTKHTAIEMAAILRGRMSAGLGLGHLDAPAASPPHPSPWKYALVMSLVSTATGWILEEIAHRTFRKRHK
ncbi:MAG TPA: hypothetical protein VIX35_00860, partial [Vicinamibacterales bacterium]